MILPSIAFWVGALADAYTTRVGLRAGFREGNPFVRYVLNVLPFNSEVELMVVKIALYAVFYVGGAELWMYYTLGGVQFAAALWNYRLLKKAGVM